MQPVSRFVRIATFAIIFIAFADSEPHSAERAQPLNLERSDYFSIIREGPHDTAHTFGDVRFTEGESALECDSAVWVMDVTLTMWGHVRVADADGYLLADSMVYDLRDSSLVGVGDSVVIVSFTDSVYARGEVAYYDRARRRFELVGRPHVRFGYPSASQRTVTAEYIQYDYQTRVGVARSRVEITDSLTRAFAECAVFEEIPERVRLYDSVKVFIDRAYARGDYVFLGSEGRTLRRAVIYDNAVMTFDEKDRGADTTSSSRLVASRIVTDCDSLGNVSRIAAYDQAFAYYTPSPDTAGTRVTNIASGDSVYLFIEGDSLRQVWVMGGADGNYRESHERMIERDSLSDTILVDVDSIHYAGEDIRFYFQDSVIELNSAAAVQDRDMKLTADRIRYETAKRFVRAFEDPALGSTPDSATGATGATDAPDAPDAPGRVTLKDGGQIVDGSYLEYSLATRKGVIRRSRTEYDRAYYTGAELYRTTDREFYVDDGEYTTCDLTPPHFHFWSKKMKIMSGDKAIAKPVILYIEKLPVFAAPFYVFPLKKGRRSGLLNFRFGSFSAGNRYLSNVGYFWAASDYWDWENSFDYYEDNGLKLNSRVRYKKRYVFDGYVQANHAWDAAFDSRFQEVKSRRWSLTAAHSHVFDPTFSVRGSGTFVSDKRFYQDFSNNLNDRLNRNLRSAVSASKTFGRASLSGGLTHTVDLDNETRSDELPSATLSLPAFPLFGAPKKGETGRWHHSLYSGYGATLNNQSNARPDTPVGRLRNAYTVVRHSTSLRSSFRALEYITVNVGAPYTENWFMIWRTNGAARAGVAQNEFTRTYATSFSAGLGTKIYGTTSFNLLGLRGLRHSFEPTVSWTYTPAIVFDNQTVKGAQSVGAQAGSRQGQGVNFSLTNGFDGKVGEGDDERKFKIVTLTSSISYNPEATSHRWSDLTSDFQTSILGRVQVSGDMRHSFYENGGLQEFSVRSTVNLRGAFGVFSGLSGRPTADSVSDSTRLQTGLSSGRRSWSLNLNHNYSKSGKDIDAIKQHQLWFSLSYQMTPNLSLSFSQYYDIIRDVTINRRLELRRKIHCWEGEFSWVPSGSNAGYYFRINVISIPDIKYESTTSPTRSRFF